MHVVHSVGFAMDVDFRGFYLTRSRSHVFQVQPVTSHVDIFWLFPFDLRCMLWIPLVKWWVNNLLKSWWTSTSCFSTSTGASVTSKSHVTHKTESPWPLDLKHSRWWKRRRRSKFASHYARGPNRVCECKMDVKSTWIPTWHQMDRVSWSLGLFSKTTSWG